MELKDMILSTLAELEEPVKEIEKETQLKEQTLKPLIEEEIKEIKEVVVAAPQIEEEKYEPTNKSDERAFCESLRERVLVLFEGFQSPNNKNIEAKVDLTLNFLEYLLAVVDERLEMLDSQKK